MIHITEAKGVGDEVSCICVWRTSKEGSIEILDDVYGARIRSDATAKYTWFPMYCDFLQLSVRNLPIHAIQSDTFSGYCAEVYADAQA